MEYNNAEQSTPSQGILVDSDYNNLSEAIGLTGKDKSTPSGGAIPECIIEDLRLVMVKYKGLDNILHQGQLVVHKDLEAITKQLFVFILEIGFGVEKVIPIVKYGWNDIKSMEDNNTSAFNYRKISGTTRLSNHATGRALDINTRYNPFIKDDIVEPSNTPDILKSMEGWKNASFDDLGPEFYFKLGTSDQDTMGGKVTQKFIDLGFVWGGNWSSLKDLHHFEKA